MADLNALIAQGAQFRQPTDPFTQYAQMQQLQTGQQNNQLNQLKLAAAQREMQTKNQLDQAYTQSIDPTTGKLDYNKVSEYLASVGAGGQIPTAQKHQYEVQKAGADLAKVQEDVRVSQSKALGTGLLIAKDNPTDENLASAFGTMKASGINVAPLEQTFASTPDLTKRKEIITNYATQHPEGIAALNFVKPDPIEVKLGDGSIKFIDKNPNSPTFKQEVMPPQAAGMTPYQTEQLGIAREQLGISKARLDAEVATGALTPETRDFLAEMYRQTGTLPPMGIGKASAKMKTEVLNRAAELSTAGGAAPAAAASEVVTNKAELAGKTAGQRAIGTQEANIRMASTELEKMIPIAESYVAKVNPTDYPLLNKTGNFIARNTGDPNIVGLATALNSLVNVYARAISPKGIPTVSDKNHAREIVQEAMAKGQLGEAFKVMRQESAAAKASGPEVRAGMRGAPPAAPGGVDTSNPLLR